MEWTGHLQPMKHQWENPVQYFARVGEENIALNQALGEEVWIRFENEIACCYCGRKIKKTYNQGYCYPCAFYMY
ncbi:DUF2797 domain-containing protein [Salinithrix halophila]|uniref:DUF2797 domain-containing protein n=1 Tax=Salinithrix halophila TaxID=1485204 RepID=A0ABV8JAJ0_9BACL